MGLGIMSALGRVILGGLADVRGRFSLELCCAGALAAFQLGFGLLELDQRLFLRPALWLQVFGFGGLMAIAPVALRASF
eukprot:2391816-Heterocapsa_arctica.AAC.1